MQNVKPILLPPRGFFVITSPPAPVAQLDRALPSGGRGQTFKSSRVHHQNHPPNAGVFCILKNPSDGGPTGNVVLRTGGGAELLPVFGGADVELNLG